MKVCFCLSSFLLRIQMKQTNQTEPNLATPLVAIIMGSKSDWETMKNASDILHDFEIPHECKVVSAHRTPDLLFEFAKSAEARGIEVIIAGAGGAAHLPGMCASQTCVPVLGVPVKSKALNGIDSLLSIVQMPAGIPVGTMAIGDAGAKNAALLAISILSNTRKDLREKLRQFRETQTQNVLESGLD
jgi:5-(carboxyamino)imidazole ribonucleotide mutase